MISCTVDTVVVRLATIGYEYRTETAFLNLNLPRGIHPLGIVPRHWEHPKCAHRLEVSEYARLMNRAPWTSGAA